MRTRDASSCMLFVWSNFGETDLSKFQRRLHSFAQSNLGAVGAGLCLNEIKTANRTDYNAFTVFH